MIVRMHVYKLTLAPPWVLFLKTHQEGAYLFVILMHLMCIPQNGRTFCDIFTFDARVYEGRTFSQTKVFRMEHHCFFLIYNGIFIKIVRLIFFASIN